jgi:hypothetical protein
MGSYELEEEHNQLHYTGSGWITIDITEEEKRKFKNGKISGYELFNDGREVK